MAKHVWESTQYYYSVEKCKFNITEKYHYTQIVMTKV